MSDEFAGLPVVRDERVPRGCVLIGDAGTVARLLADEGAGTVDTAALLGAVVREDEVAVIRLTRPPGH